ncbi:MAG TPA: TAXI family TRAP transporter solute-binding subunit, partial [Myxococcales bacterium]|nr:TAXI family TRAP transporter solute-binding subunit [Myxococcales bacterium]
MSIAGCSSGKSDKERQEPAAAPARTVDINVATATTGGAYYPIGNAIAQLWNDKVPGVKASAQATNGTP